MQSQLDLAWTMASIIICFALGFLWSILILNNSALIG